jgi:hypothetical protein
MTLKTGWPHGAAKNAAASPRGWPHDPENRVAPWGCKNQGSGGPMWLQTGIPGVIDVNYWVSRTFAEALSSSTVLHGRQV